MSSAVRIVFSFVLSATLLGCWIPEKFTAKIVVNKDGSYRYSYDGILTYAPALAAARDGNLSAKHEAAFKKEEEKIRNEPGFKKVTYSGNGRYEVAVERARKAGEPTYFVSKEALIFSVIPKQDGTVEIAGLKLTDKKLAQLGSIGAKVDGYLKVSVGKGVEVIKHNATATPRLFGTFGEYEWRIKSPDAAPFIVLRPAS